MSLSRLAGTIALAALAVFSWGLRDDAFVDEYAYITQSYYSDLFFEGRCDDPAWLEFFAFDLQPLPKYFIGLGLHLARMRMPTASDAYRWYRNAHYRFGPPEALTAARIPFIATGVLGSLALLGCGLLIGGRRVGTIAAVLLIANPLFRLHAHRAMSDVPCEGFMIAALALALWGITRIWTGRGIVTGLGLLAGSGVGSGLSIACKLNGLLAPMAVIAWCGLGLLVPGLTTRVRLGLAGGAALSIAALLITVIGLNPTYTSHPTVQYTSPEHIALAGQGPWGRFREMVYYRLRSTAQQQQYDKFLRDVVRSPAEKLGVFAVQGFGRFGPFGPSKSDSTVRYEIRQDWGLALWWPLVLLGVFHSFRLGRRQLRDGAPPTALALLLWAMVSWAVVAAYVPMAWDRYLLPIQAPDALLAGVGLVATADRWWRKAVAT